VLAAIAFMVGAKLANVGVPLLLKQLVDAMDAAGRRRTAALLVVPVGLLLAYGDAAPGDLGVQRAARTGVRQGHARRGAQPLRCKTFRAPARAERCAFTWSARPAA
jgi:hypothetical protein